MSTTTERVEERIWVGVGGEARTIWSRSVASETIPFIIADDGARLFSSSSTFLSPPERRAVGEGSLSGLVNLDAAERRASWAGEREEKPASAGLRERPRRR